MALQSKGFTDIFGFWRAGGATDWVNGQLTHFANNTVRRNEAGWLIEGGSTNGIPNIREMLGATVGSPGTAPTGWGNFLGTSGGFTREIVNIGTEANGLRFFDVRVTGTNVSGGAALPINILASPSADYLPITTGQNYSSQVWMKIVEGGLGTSTVSMGLSEVDAAKTGLSSWKLTNLTLDATWKEHRTTVVPTQAAVAFAAPQLWVTTPGNASINITLRIGGYQAETNTLHHSSLMMPEAGQSGAGSRGTEFIVLSGANFNSVFGAGAPRGFVIVDCLMPVHTNVVRVIAQVESGGTYIHCRPNQSGTTVLGVSNVVSGQQLTTPSGGTVVFGQTTRWGMRWADGVMSVAHNGGAVSSLPLTTFPVFDTLRLGNTSSGAAPLNGRISNCWAGSGPAAFDDARFAAACSPGADISTIFKT